MYYLELYKRLLTLMVKHATNKYVGNPATGFGSGNYVMVTLKPFTIWLTGTRIQVNVDYTYKFTSKFNVWFSMVQRANILNY
jgi:hypothetical protein